MKKLFSVLCAMVIIVIASIGGMTIANAGTYEEESDLAFLKAFEQLLSDEGIVVDSVKIDKDPVYDLSLNQLGYVYTINLPDNQGFALSVNTDGIFEVTEIYLDALNPYSGYTGQKIYISLLFYLVYQDGEYIETSTGYILDDEALDTMRPKAFSASDNTIWDETEVIWYTRRVSETFGLALNHPTNTTGGLSNACAPSAGANIIHYYTRFYPELIPGFTPGAPLLDRYVYTSESDAVIPTIHTLYNYMQTNVTAPGTTIAEFRMGMTRFCNEKGRNISYNSCMQGGSFYFNLAKQRLQEMLPLVLFVDTFTVASLTNVQGSYEGISYVFVNACHAMPGFGYQEISYTLTNGQNRTDKYIAVATGLGTRVKGYFNTSYYTQIDEAYAINIY